MEEKKAVTDVEITSSIIHGGGRAGPHEWGWVAAGYDLDQVESLRLQLLAQNDYGQVQKAMQQVGITVDRALLRLVKRYNFDSPGLGFLYKNYRAWRNLATRKGTLGMRLIWFMKWRKSKSCNRSKAKQTLTL